MPNSVQTYTFAQLEALWIQAGGDRASAPIMAAIALAESSGNPAAVNHNNDGSTDRGLWQINSVHGSLSTFDPMANAKAAVKIKSTQGLSAWVTYTSGAYRKFLGSAAPDNNLPSGSTSTATPADLPGDLGSAIGQGLGSAFQALFQPLISTMIWGGEILLGMGLMIGGIVIFALNTEPGRETVSAGKGIATDTLGATMPELSPVALARTRAREYAQNRPAAVERRVQREQQRQMRQKQIRAEARHRNKAQQEKSS